MEWYHVLLIILGSLMLLAGLLYLIAGVLVWKMCIPTAPVESYRNKPSDDPIENDITEYKIKELERIKALPMEDIWIKSKDGLNLHAFYKEAPSKTDKVIISVHGYHGDALDTTPLFSSFLLDYNYNILCIDLRSYGQSEGKYTTYGVKDHVDLLDWINYLKERFDNKVSIALFGISMGGNTVLMTSDKVPQEVKCIIDDCGYTTPIDEFKACLRAMKLPEFFVYSGEFINLIICHWHFRWSAPKCLAKAKVPILFIHGEEDEFVPTYMAKENYDACVSKKELKYFSGKGHARSYYYHKEEYKNLVLDFLVHNL